MLLHCVCNTDQRRWGRCPDAGLIVVARPSDSAFFCSYETSFDSLKTKRTPHHGPNKTRAAHARVFYHHRAHCSILTRSLDHLWHLLKQPPAARPVTLHSRAVIHVAFIRVSQDPSQLISTTFAEHHKLVRPRSHLRELKGSVGASLAVASSFTFQHRMRSPPPEYHVPFLRPPKSSPVAMNSHNTKGAGIASHGAPRCDAAAPGPSMPLAKSTVASSTRASTTAR